MPLRRAIRPWLFPWLLTLFAIVAAEATVGWIIRGALATNFASAQKLRSAQTLLFSCVVGQLNEESGLRGYVATRDPQFLQPYVYSKLTLPADLSKLKLDLAKVGLPEAAAAAADAANANDAWLRFVAYPSLSHGGRSSLTRQKAGKNLIDRFRRDTNLIAVQLQNHLDGLLGHLEQSLLALSILIALTALALFIVGTSFALITASAWRKLARTEDQHAQARLQASTLKAAYDAEKRLANVLQLAITRRRLPKIPSLSIDAVYVSAAEERLVGGDWFDALDIGGQRLLIVVGDVAGHGIEAAVAMNRAREAVFEAAIAELEPAAILQRANQRLVEEGSVMVTASVGIAYGRTCEFHYASAGHPPPIVASSTSAPQRLAFGEIPLGVVGNAAYHSHRVQLSRDALLVLYTDGAIEGSHDILEGEQRLWDAIAATGDASNAASQIYHIVFRDSRPVDDVAILTLKFVGDSARVAVPSEVAEAR